MFMENFADSHHGVRGSGPTSSFCGRQADIPALRALRPELLDFDTWLARGGRRCWNSTSG
jgi:hypothetical protein